MSRRSWRRSPRAGSGPTSCRAASGRSRRRRASRTTGSRSKGVGKTDADLQAAVRATAAGRTPLAWVALESGDEAEVLARMAQRAGLGRRGRPPLDVLVRLNPDVTPETIDALAVGAGASKFGMTETEATGVVGWLASGARRGDPAARRPPACRLAAPRRRRVARRGPSRARGRRPAAREPGHLRHARCRRRLPGLPAR